MSANPGVGGVGFSSGARVAEGRRSEATEASPRDLEGRGDCLTVMLDVTYGLYNL